MNAAVPAPPEVALSPSPPAGDSPTPTGSPAEHPAVHDVCWGLSGGDRWFLGAAGGLSLLLLAAHLALMARWGAPAVEIVSLQPRETHYSLDINAATWVEWLQLPGIGETMSRRIVEDREKRGPFRSIDDVGRVRGIGPKTLEQLRPYLRPVPAAIEPNPVQP